MVNKFAHIMGLGVGGWVLGERVPCTGSPILTKFEHVQRLPVEGLGSGPYTRGRGPGLVQGAIIVNRMTDRQTRLKTLPSGNLVDGR